MTVLLNVVLVDGLAQSRTTPKQSESAIDAGWVTNDSFDYAQATYDGTSGAGQSRPAPHKREVRFCKPDFFVVTDTLVSLDGNEHAYEVLFHLDTTKVKQLDEYKNVVISDIGRKSMVA